MMSGIASEAQDLRIMHREGSVGMNMGRDPATTLRTGLACRSHWARATALWARPACKGGAPWAGTGGRTNDPWNERACESAASKVVPAG